MRSTFRVFCYIDRQKVRADGTTAVWCRLSIDGKRAVVEKNSYPVPPIFKMMAREGNVEEQMMYNTYNMGLGMIVAVDPADVDKTMEAMKSAGDTPYVVGKIIDGEKGVDLV